MMHIAGCAWDLLSAYAQLNKQGVQAVEEFTGVAGSTCISDVGDALDEKRQRCVRDVL